MGARGVQDAAVTVFDPVPSAMAFFYREPLLVISEGGTELGFDLPDAAAYIPSNPNEEYVGYAPYSPLLVKARSKKASRRDFNLCKECARAFRVPGLSRGRPRVDPFADSRSSSRASTPASSTAGSPDHSRVSPSPPARVPLRVRTKTAAGSGRVMPSPLVSAQTSPPVRTLTPANLGKVASSSRSSRQPVVTAVPLAKEFPTTPAFTMGSLVAEGFSNITVESHMRPGSSQSASHAPPFAMNYHYVGMPRTVLSARSAPPIMNYAPSLPYSGRMPMPHAPQWANVSPHLPFLAAALPPNPAAVPGSLYVPLSSAHLADPSAPRPLSGSSCPP